MGAFATAAVQGNSINSAYERLFAVMGKFDLYGNYAMDPLLRSRRELVTQILGMVDHPANLELSVAAMQIIQDMASSATFDPLPGAPHKLYTILEEAGCLGAVRQAFINRLEREEEEQVRSLSPEGAQALLDSDASAAYEFGLANIVRLQILDFLVQNCAKPGYNLAHYLLGFDAERGVKESCLKEEDDNCLFLILDVLDYGLGEADCPVVLLEHPSFASKAYELVWALLSGRSTNKPLMKLFACKASRFHGFVSRHFSQGSKALLSPADVYLTAHELRSKAALFSCYALELNIASQFRHQTISLDERVLVEYLKAAKAAISQPMMLDAVDMAEFAASVTGYFSGLSRLIQVLLLASLNTNAVEPILLHYVSDSTLTLEAREALAMALLLGVSKNRASGSPELVPCIVQVLGQVESSLSLRGYLYSTFCALPVHSLSSHGALLKASLPRLAEVAVKDVTAPGSGLEAWKTLAVSFLTRLVAVCPSLTQTLAQSGGLKAIVQSVRGDEAALEAFFSAASPLLNAVYLWKAKMALFKAMLLPGTSFMELLLGAGLMDVLSTLRIIDRSLLGEEDACLPSALQPHFQEVVSSVLSLVVLAAQQNRAELGHSQLHHAILRFIGGHFELLSRQLVLKATPRASPLLSLAADLVDYAGSDLVPLAARHNISLRHLLTNMLVKSLLAIERDALEPTETTGVCLSLASHALQFIAGTRLESPETSIPLVDFDDLPGDRLTLEGKLPIAILERLIIVFNKVMKLQKFYRAALKAFEQLVFVVLLDLEDRLAQDSKPAKPYAIATYQAVTKARDLLRPALSKHIESFSTSTTSGKDASDPVMQTCQRWVRQLLFLLRE